jgi:hypothetical protein
LDTPHQIIMNSSKSIVTIDQLQFQSAAFSISNSKTSKYRLVINIYIHYFRAISVVIESQLSLHSLLLYVGTCLNILSVVVLNCQLFQRFKCG